MHSEKGFLVLHMIGQRPIVPLAGCVYSSWVSPVFGFNCTSQAQANETEDENDDVHEK